MNVPVKKPKQALMLGNIPVESGDQSSARIAMILWGAAGVGKTVFAATAPGGKLWISFGDNEHVSVSHREDVQVVNASSLEVASLFNACQNDNPFGLDRFLSEQKEVKTIVVDSLTAIAFRALQKAVYIDKTGMGKGFVPSMEAPGIAAYGARNAIVLEVITGFLRVTAKHDVHCIFTSHEDDPTCNDAGVVEYVTMQLGGKLVNNTTWRLSEIWYLSEESTGKRRRRLAVRRTRQRQPMKTRMFRNDQDPEFTLVYNMNKEDDAKGQMTISQWHEEWLKGGRNKIDIPKEA